MWLHMTAMLASLLFPMTAQATDITSLASIGATGDYVITADIDASGFNASIAEFSGTLEAAINPTTHMPYRIKNLSVPLFTTLSGTVKNLLIENVTISQSGIVGAVACTANGSARIYNVGILSGSVGGTGNVGGLVGFLDGTARVVNCYSYATITSGTNVGGIVGYNNQTTSAANNNQKTMVFACMFYGDITGGSTKSPVYGGTIISNAGTNTTSGVSNFNYFRLEAPYVQPTGITYNCALGAEDRFLKRFEFFRHLLNSHRELAGWWVTGTYSKSGMMKWVLDKSIAPYPILKEEGKYSSVVNYHPDSTYHPTTGAKIARSSVTTRNQGGTLGTLTVNIQMGDGAVFTRPTGAAITTSQLTLNITDKVLQRGGYQELQRQPSGDGLEDCQHHRRHARHLHHIRQLGWIQLRRPPLYQQGPLLRQRSHLQPRRLLGCTRRGDGHHHRALLGQMRLPGRPKRRQDLQI